MHRIHEMKNTLISWAQEEISKGCIAADADDLGKVVDMIKDLCEAEYYHSIVEAMHEEIEGEYEGRSGYDNRRYASGRFAPKGHGHISGYMPPYMEPHMDMMEGYTPSGRGNRSQSGRYGYNYDKYNEARRNYHESRHTEDKHEMNEHAKKHLEDTVETLEDIYKDADPELKTRMKQDLGKLMNEMK